MLLRFVVGWLSWGGNIRSGCCDWDGWVGEYGYVVVVVLLVVFLCSV